MAKAKVTIICKTCGEKFTWSKECNNRESANKAEEWALKNVEKCPACQCKEKIEIENKKAQKIAEELKLPKLEGSDKQIAWANTIRTQFLENYKEIKSSSQKRPKNKKICEIFEDVINKETTAKFWIDNRYCNIEDLTINKD